MILPHRLGLLALVVAASLFPLTSRAADITEGEVHAVAAANDALALDLYDQLKTAPGNLVFSPLSLSTALNMTSLGASGKTADEFAKVAHRPDISNFHAIAGMFLPAFAKSKAVTIVADNHLWIQSSLAVRPAFLEKTAKFYGAAPTSLDFAKSDDARKTINNAVSEKTAGKISDLLPSGALNPNTRMVLTNTLYFRGNWADAFSKNATTDDDFHTAPDKTVKAPTMHNTGTYPFTQTADYQAVELPYTGKRFALLLLVPRQGKSLEDLEKRLTPEHLQDIGANINPSRIALSVPRFTVTREFNAAQTLAKLGLPSAFSDEADFSNITGDKSLHLAGAYHKTYIAVDETGTEAASAAAFVAGTKGIEAAPARIAFDRPFLFMLIEKNSRLIFFMGRINDPTK